MSSSAYNKANSAFGSTKIRCECGKAVCAWGTVSFETKPEKNTDNFHNTIFDCVKACCTFGNNVSIFDKEVMETADSTSWWSTDFPNNTFEEVPETSTSTFFPDVSFCKKCKKPDCSFQILNTKCDTCGPAHCTREIASFDTEEDKDNFHKIIFDCLKVGFGGNVSKFEEGEVLVTEEGSFWWPTPFQASIKGTISLADILKKFCKCYLEVENMTVNKDQCLLHGIHSDADEEEESEDDDGYFCR